MVIKLVDKYTPDCPEGSIELRIFRLLNSPSMRTNPRNATIPVLEFLEFHGWTFIVMPAYESCDAYYFLSSRECLDFACQVSEVIYWFKSCTTVTLISSLILGPLLFTRT